MQRKSLRIICALTESLPAPLGFKSEVLPLKFLGFGVRIPAGERDFSSLPQPPVQWVPEVKRPGRDADDLSPASAFMTCAWKPLLLRTISVLDLPPTYVALTLAFSFIFVKVDRERSVEYTVWYRLISSHLLLGPSEKKKRCEGVA
jgi:hypothetical protein